MPLKPLSHDQRLQQTAKYALYIYTPLSIIVILCIPMYLYLRRETPARHTRYTSTDWCGTGAALYRAVSPCVLCARLARSRTHSHTLAHAHMLNPPHIHPHPFTSFLLGTHSPMPLRLRRHMSSQKSCGKYRTDFKDDDDNNNNTSTSTDTTITTKTELGSTARVRGAPYYFRA